MSVNFSNVLEFEPHKFVAEAAELGLRPGEWPMKIAAEIGNRMPFMRRSKKVDAEGDIQWVTYEQANGCLTLRVFND